MWPYNAWSSPYAASWAAPYAHAVHAPWAHAPITQYSSYPAYHAPLSVAHHVAAPWAHPAVVPVAKVAASYTAATRGAVHTAPLEGHAISQTSLNLAPAPGTL